MLSVSREVQKAATCIAKKVSTSNCSPLYYLEIIDYLPHLPLDPLPDEDVAQASDLDIAAGRSPISVAAAAIYMASQVSFSKNGNNKTKGGFFYKLSNENIDIF